MAERPRLLSDREITPEELAGVGRSRRFDEVIDNQEFEEVQVIFKRGDEEVSLARPSRAFYFGDRPLYEEEARRFEKREADRILNSDRFRRNIARFEDLKRSCRRGMVVPFIGAGMSAGAGCPSWKGYLLDRCKEANLDLKAMQRRLDADGDFEGVMNDVVTTLGVRRFNRDFERDFKAPREIVGAVRLLPGVFGGSIMTTNFDRVLETVYSEAGLPFEEKISGRGSANSFFRAIPGGSRYLLKLHGNLDTPSERVLNRIEYEAAYGADGQVDLDRPLPRLLNRLFASYTFLFLGCSLYHDRTVRTFIRVAEVHGSDNLPHHYAILEHPSETDKLVTLEERLADANITPIWFPEGEFQYLEEILQLLEE